MSFKEMFCKHKKYTVTFCKKESKVYVCKCDKCGSKFELPKAEGEMYLVGSQITLI